jgi:hypothetical protein
MKVQAANTERGTPLTDVYGIGTLTLLGLAPLGYQIDALSTVGDFVDEVGSFSALQNRIREKGVDKNKYKYILTRFRALLEKHGGEEEVKATTGPPLEKPQEEDPVDIQNNDNFLKPREQVPGPDTSKYPEVVGNPIETPELMAMDDDVQREAPAVATGKIAATVPLTVVPDETLNISPSDRVVADPVTEDVPMVDHTIPVASLGNNFAGQEGARDNGFTTLQEKHEQDMEAESTTGYVKANFQADLKSDGKGNLGVQDQIGSNAPPEPDSTKMDTTETTTSSSKFKFTPLGQSKPVEATDSTKEKEAENFAQKVKNTTYHPFKQASLFRDHDRMAKRARMINETSKVHKMIMSASRGFGASVETDPSFRRFNAATQGVEMVEMPLDSSNFLSRNTWTTSFQYDGANPLQRTFPYSPFENQMLLGRF